LTKSFVPGAAFLLCTSWQDEHSILFEKSISLAMVPVLPGGPESFVDES
jgi:hypothetical protein